MRFRPPTKTVFLTIIGQIKCIFNVCFLFSLNVVERITMLIGRNLLSLTGHTRTHATQTPISQLTLRYVDILVSHLSGIGELIYPKGVISYSVAQPQSGYHLASHQE